MNRHTTIPLEVEQEFRRWTVEEMVPQSEIGHGVRWFMEQAFYAGYQLGTTQAQPSEQVPA